MSIFTVKKITDKIVLLKSSTQREIAESVIRFQEYYESPIPEIKGKIFTLGYLKSLYATSKRTQSGAFTYLGSSYIDPDWNGFNFPSHVLEPFIKGLFDPLTEGEEAILELFRHRTDKFYIIGIHEEDESAIDHEVAHGLFYTDDKLRNQVKKILSTHNLSGFKKVLKSWGYCDDEEILLDECWAYIACDWESWVLDNKMMDLKKYKVDVEDITKLHKKLNKLFKKQKLLK